MCLYADQPANVSCYGSLFKDLVSRLDIVCPPQKDSKLPLPTTNYAKKHGITIHQYQPPLKTALRNLSPEQQTDPNTISSLENLYNSCQNHLQSMAKEDQFDIGVVVDFGYLIPAPLLSAFKFSPILMHPSLLPNFRGAAPIERSIMSGVSETGVSVLDVHPSHFDAGKILLQKPYTIPDNLSGSEIRVELAKLGANALIQCLENYDRLIVDAKQQDPNPVSKAPKIKPDDYMARFELESPTQLYYRIKALGPLTTMLYGSSGTKSTHADGRIRVLIHSVVRSVEDHPNSPILPADAPIGSIVFDKPRNLIWCKCVNDELSSSKEKPWVAINSLQFENGHRRMDAVSFANGIRLKSNPTQKFVHQD